MSTHLIINNGIPNIVRHCGRGLNIVLTILVTLGTDAIAEHFPTIPNQPQGSRRELTQ